VIERDVPKARHGADDVVAVGEDVRRDVEVFARDTLDGKAAAVHEGLDVFNDETGAAVEI
jgi:hypothetical protein